MTHVLLLGAGFSKNWNGWLTDEVFEYLLGRRAIAEDQELTQILWNHNQSGNGFEGALEEVQQAHRQNPQMHQRRLEVFQSAVTQMLDDMNGAFFDRGNLEFENVAPLKVTTFLSRFDAIFTLNQDLLIEHGYKDQTDISLLTPRRWDGMYLPGMQRIPAQESLYSNSWARSAWIPLPENEFRIERHVQPYFKLHGSSNWRSAAGSPILVMGGQKAYQIGLHPVLRWYAREFESALLSGGVRLMAIGYGFRDLHINELIIRAATEAGLRMFVVAPDGANLAMSLNPTRRGNQIICPTSLEEVFRGLCGASRRLLSTTFSTDVAEFRKIQDFFDA